MAVIVNGSGSISGVTGSVLQVQSTTKTDIFSTTSTSFVDVTGFDATITPRSASNKILITIVLSFAIDGSVSAMQAQMFRGSTQIAMGDASGTRTRATWTRLATPSGYNSVSTATMTFLDSPNTTSSVTYKMMVRSDQGTAAVFINRGLQDTDAPASSARGISTITLMEIAA